MLWVANRVGSEPARTQASAQTEPVPGTHGGDSRHDPESGGLAVWLGESRVEASSMTGQLSVEIGWMETLDGKSRSRGPGLGPRTGQSQATPRSVVVAPWKTNLEPITGLDAGLGNLPGRVRAGLTSWTGWTH